MKVVELRVEPLDACGWRRRVMPTGFCIFPRKPNRICVFYLCFGRGGVVFFPLREANKNPPLRHSDSICGGVARHTFAACTLQLSGMFSSSLCSGPSLYFQIGKS